MIKEQRRFIIDKLYPSLNEFMGGKGYWMKNKLKKEWVTYISNMLLIAEMDYIENYHLILTFNNRKDCDNNIMILKYFNDALQTGGYIKDDSTKVWKGFEVWYDPGLDKGTCIIHLLYSPKLIDLGID